MKNKFDVTVIGGGPGGYVAAIRAAQLGANTALVEKEHVGGTCLNWGCIPTKSLIASATLFQRFQHADEFGIRVEGSARPDWSAIQQRKNRIVQELRQGIEHLLKSNQVTVFKGTAEFSSRRKILVRSNEHDQKPDSLESGRVIIASGSASTEPSFIPKADNIYYSRQALELESLPKEIIILGGGVIGCEFACMFAQLGVKVKLVEMLPRILPMVDLEAARVVEKSMKSLGIELFTGVPMENIKSSSRRVTASVGEQTVAAENMLVCIGRRPYSDGLNLGNIGLDTDENGFLPVDSHCRTRVSCVYAIGDLTGPVQYAHRASAQAMVAAEEAVAGGSRPHSDRLVPGCIFTSPEIGSVGLTEEEASEQGIQYNVGNFPLAALGKAKIEGETNGFCKIIADKSTDQVLGVHIVGPHATDLIAEAATAMQQEITAEEIGRAIHAHPTLGEVTMEAAHAVHQQCIHLPPPRRKKNKKG